MLEFDRHTGQGGNRLAPLGLSLTLLTAAAFPLGLEGWLADFFCLAVFDRGGTVYDPDRIPRCERNERFGRSLGREQDEDDRRFHPPTTPLRLGRWPAEESVS
jgi:hypothetical protein